jgi:hypothetical protein
MLGWNRSVDISHGAPDSLRVRITQRRIACARRGYHRATRAMHPRQRAESQTFVQFEYVGFFRFSGLHKPHCARSLRAGLDPQASTSRSVPWQLGLSRLFAFGTS